MFFTGKPFHSGLMFDSKAGSYLFEASFCNPFFGRLLALPANKVERLARDKHSNFQIKKFYNIGLGDLLSSLPTMLANKLISYPKMC